MRTRTASAGMTEVDPHRSTAERYWSGFKRPQWCGLIHEDETMKPEFRLDDMRGFSVADLTAPGGWIETVEDLSAAGFDRGEIAEKLNCTVGAVKYLLFYWEHRRDQEAIR